ncbi:MAG: DUF2203 domain-containing protein [Ignavibacteriaceae bacterium]|jgi:hypothetical protein|nr:DUF2203 domain-containing protein [Ignavibacteriaceae bacterium]
MTTQIKYFTPDEARRTLPLVRKIVKDILETGRQMRLIADELLDDSYNNSEFIRLAELMNSYLAELEEIGCYYKDSEFSQALVDFPAIIDGKDVFLCWKSDEEDIIYYHETDAGFRGRKLIPRQYLNKN